MNIKKIIKSGIILSLLLFINPNKSYALSNVKQIETTSGTSFALKNDGTVWSWGDNNYGELGQGDFINRNAPSKIKSINNVKEIITGDTNVFAIKNDGTVWGWGSNTRGELGIGDKKRMEVNIPTQIKGLTNVKKMVSGYANTIVLKNDGTVWACGQNHHGELGVGFDIVGEEEYAYSFIQIESLSDVKNIEMAYNTIFAMKEDGTVWGWGLNGSGELGLGDKEDRHIPTEIKALENVKKIITGPYHLFAIKEDGTIWSWGENADGELCLGDDEYRITPTQVTQLDDVKDIYLGWGESFAIKNDGSLWAWGGNYSGGLGINSEEQTYVPVKVENFQDIKEISSGASFALALKNDGSVWVTGDNDYGQLGLNDKINRRVFTKITSLEEILVETAEETRNQDDIEIARDAVNKMPETDEKDMLQNRLNIIEPGLEFEVKNATANLDVYIKSKNMLSLSLSTNNITFEDFSGVDDMEKLNAINLTVNSSLPYKINAYLPNEIVGIRYKETMDKRIFNIRANGESDYQTFVDTSTPITLLDNQLEGNKKIHGIDLKLKGGLTLKKDVYRATVKFEIVQK